MDSQNNSSMLYDMSGRLLDIGDNIIIPSEGSGTIYKIVNTTEKSIIIQKNEIEVISHLASECIKMV